MLKNPDFTQSLPVSTAVGTAVLYFAGTPEAILFICTELLRVLATLEFKGHLVSVVALYAHDPIPIVRQPDSW